MKLIFSPPTPTHSTLIFPFVGEWRSGKVKDVSDDIGKQLLEKFSPYLKEVDEHGKVKR